MLDDAAFFARLGLDTWGVDISESAVEAAKKVSSLVVKLKSLMWNSVQSYYAQKS